MTDIFSVGDIQMNKALNGHTGFGRRTKEAEGFLGVSNFRLHTANRRQTLRWSKTFNR